MTKFLRVRKQFTFSFHIFYSKSSNKSFRLKYENCNWEIDYHNNSEWDAFAFRFAKIHKVETFIVT